MEGEGWVTGMMKRWYWYYKSVPATSARGNSVHEETGCMKGVDVLILPIEKTCAPGMTVLC